MRPVIALVVAASLAGCSLVTSLDDLRSADGGAASDATDDSPDGSTNLIGNPSFDQGTGGCGPNWGDGYNETFMRTSPGHTGSYACLVCLQNGASGGATPFRRRRSFRCSQGRTTRKRG